MILYPHYPAAAVAAAGGGGGGDLRKRSNEQQRQQVLQAVYDFAWSGEGSDVKYRDPRRHVYFSVVQKMWPKVERARS